MVWGIFSRFAHLIEGGWWSKAIWAMPLYYMGIAQIAMTYRTNTFQKGAQGTFISICLNQRQIVLIIFIEIIFFLFHLHRRLTGIQCSSHFSRSSSKSQFTNWGVILTSQLINWGTRLRRQLINWGTRLRGQLINWGTILRSQSANLSSRKWQTEINLTSENVGSESEGDQEPRACLMIWEWRI